MATSKGLTTSRASAATTASVARVIEALAQTWPDAVCELDFTTPFELLTATILAAQSTDKIINSLSPALFAKYPNARALAVANPAELEQLIYSSGFYRAKAKNLLAMARHLVEHHDGEVPRTMVELVKLAGVARKTANVVLGTAMGLGDGIVVDTHVTRLSNRLGLTQHTDPVKIERDLQALVPERERVMFANRLIWHGRRVCHGPKPACDDCTLAPLCPSVELLALGGNPPAKSRRRPSTPTSTGNPVGKTKSPTKVATGPRKRKTT